MSGIATVLSALVLTGLSGVPGALGRRRKSGPRIAAASLVAGGGLGLLGLVTALGAASATLSRPWFLPWGRFAVGVDSLGAVFLGLVFVVPAMGAVYALGYGNEPDHPANGRRLGFFYGLLAASMALVVLARDAVLFLVAWEVMAIAAFFAATTEEDDPAVRSAGWVYLVATHVGTLCLIAAFALLRHATGSFDLEAVRALPSGTADGIFALSAVGFGIKAGLVPLHVWLPGAHANAQSHVSAVMSGVMLKMGVYGIVRMTAILGAPEAWWGGALLVAGAVSAVWGIAYAIGQSDLKRLLAYSSIENVGIVAMAIGLSLLGRSEGRPDWVALGLGACLFHVWNHGLFKGLLFLNAGAILHATHTRRLEGLGGLAARMPLVTGLFAVGALAVCALPPLNGFVGEWVLYVGLFRTVFADPAGAGLPAAAVAAVVLSAVGALAVACFVKLFGTAFLGSARSDAAATAHDGNAWAVAPMAILAALCLASGLFPSAAAPLVDRAAAAWAPGQAAALPTLASLVPLGWVTEIGLSVLAGAGLLALLLLLAPRAKTVGRAGTWDCGYARPAARMQYTPSSFGQMLVDLLSPLLWPRSRMPAVRGPFPGAATFERDVPDGVLDRIVLPALSAAGRQLQRLRVLQHGQLQPYVLYVLAIVIVLLAYGARP